MPLLVEPVCQASIVRWENAAGTSPGWLLFSNPAHNKRRSNLTVRASDDNGATWSRSLILQPGGAAYSCLIALERYDRGLLLRIQRHEALRETHLRPFRGERSQGQQIKFSMHARYRGLVAAPFTPFHSDGSLNLGAIPAYARLLRENGVSAAFVCGRLAKDSRSRKPSACKSPRPG
ncbi:MAG: hypothetical protein QM760_10925 [Nibricoccus sp.]